MALAQKDARREITLVCIIATACRIAFHLSQHEAPSRSFQTSFLLFLLIQLRRALS